ncbi:MAG: asparagine synthetase B (glutamine-hydrolyzing) [Parasphingorhabdus sp.]
MGTIAAILSRKNFRVDPQQVSGMLKSTQRFQGDKPNILSQLNVAMGHVSFTANFNVGITSSVNCIQEDGLCIVFDGMLDDREAITRKLPGVLNQCHSDAGLVLNCYRYFKADCATHLSGEFVFIIHDSKTQQLLCARDRAGCKPLFFAFLNDTLLIGSEPVQLFSQPGLSPAPNQTMLVQYLLSSMSSKSDTIFREVRRLPPDHTLLLTRDTLLIKPNPSLQHYQRNIEVKTLITPLKFVIKSSLALIAEQ